MKCSIWYLIRKYLKITVLYGKSHNLIQPISHGMDKKYSTKPKRNTSGRYFFILFGK